MEKKDAAVSFGLNKFYKMLAESANMIGCICLACMTVITLTAIFWRYALNSALARGSDPLFFHRGHIYGHKRCGWQGRAFENGRAFPVCREKDSQIAANGKLPDHNLLFRFSLLSFLDHDAEDHDDEATGHFLSISALDNLADNERDLRNDRPAGIADPVSRLQK